jgi:hypothetical protein
LIAVLLLIGVLAAVGVGVYQAGLAQGYAQGATQVGSGELPGGQQFRSYPGYLPGVYRFHFGLFPFFPLFGLCLFGLLLLPLLGWIFRPRGWWGPYSHWHAHPPAWGGPWGKQPPGGEPGGEGPPPAERPEASQG